MSIRFRIALAVAGALAGLASNIGSAQSVYSEDFTGGATAHTWYYGGGACLTAGSSAGTGSPGAAPGLLPSCMSILSSYYSTRPDGDPSLVGGTTGTLPDVAGSGALRFTNGRPYGHNESGAIISTDSFNAGQGVQITFKAVTYRGDSGGAGGDGADGVSFYLLDASSTAHQPGDGVWDGFGSFGGSLGYTCSNANSPYTGVVGGYIGLGIDEYGNFLNGTSLVSGAVSGVNGVGSATGDNSALGYGYKPGRIGLRGAGSVSWAYLHATYPTYYPTSTLNTAALQAAAVQKTCQTGQVWNYSSSASSPSAVGSPSPALFDYAPIIGAYSVLPTGTTIANESINTRPDGVSTGNVFLYSLKITQDGLLTFSYSINGGAFTPVITNQSISATNGPLPSLLRFGFAGSTGGSTNVHEILCFKATPVNQSASSAAGNEKQTAEVQATSQAYFAFYNPNDWTGRAVAVNLTDSNGTLSLGNVAWDAECLLTGLPAGSTCPSTGTNGPSSATPAPASRVMLTWNGLGTAAAPGTAGVAFEYTSLTAAEQTRIDLGDSTQTANRVNYLRGDRSNEINSSGAGLYRARDGVLGDIIDSSPAWVGPPNSPYSQTWRDNLYPTTTMPENSSSGQSYLAFQAAEQGRLNTVYVGANDGFLHGFRTGSEDVNGNVISNSTTPNDGQEILAYMPGAVLNTIHNSTTTSLDYSNTQYAHNFFVDATPGTGDLYYGNAWHTWLVGGLGSGGAAIYALDVTDPLAAGTSYSESHTSTVRFERTAATLSCISPSNCGQNLGNTYGIPQIRRFHNGQWGAIFGNGIGSASGDAGIFIMLVDPSSGAPSFYYLSTGVSGSNGIAYVTTADLDGDHITDYVYANDLKGNVWRFDLTSNSASNWAVTPGPLFTAPSGQPITTPVIVAGAQVSMQTKPQIIVAFGTGKRTQFTNSSATTYVSGTQTLYGVWDWNFNAWNSRTNPTQGAVYDSLTSSQMQAATGLTGNQTLGASNLQVQTFTSGASGIDSSNNTVTYVSCAGTTTTCTSGVFGWKADLINTNGATTTGTSSGTPIKEQIVSPPSLFGSALIVNSTVPANVQILNCNSPTTDTGFLYVINVITGGTFNFGTSASPSLQSAFVNYHDANLVALATNETGAVTVLSTKENTTWVLGQDIAPTMQTNGSGAQLGGLNQINLPRNITSSRQTWVELR
jgi:type IV pilus assembly protein PilY1